MNAPGEDFAEAHARGEHQEEIVGLMLEIEPHLNGHARVIVILTLCRIIAAMLGPADREMREEMLGAIPITIGAILREMDRLMSLTTTRQQ